MGILAYIYSRIVWHVFEISFNTYIHQSSKSYVYSGSWWLNPLSNSEVFNASTNTRRYKIRQLMNHDITFMCHPITSSGVWACGWSWPSGSPLSGVNPLLEYKFKSPHTSPSTLPLPSTRTHEHTDSRNLHSKALTPFHWRGSQCNDKVTD